MALKVDFKVGLSSEDKEIMKNEVIEKVGKLTPSGTDTEANILLFVDNKGVWVATDTGNWLYFDETQQKYVVGGVYQATEIEDGSVTEEKLSSEVEDKINKIENNEEIDGLGVLDNQGNIGVHIGSKKIWNDLPYNRKYGFGGFPYGNGVLPPFSRIAGIWEADMLSVRGGKGRWNGDDTGNFEHGGHIFEGWNKEEDVRLTAGIGLNNKNIGWLQTFHPANEEGTDGGAYYGITKIGSDLDGEGCNFMPTVTMAQSAFVLWNRPTSYVPQINDAQLNLLIESGEIPDYMTNSNDKMIVGGMYYDTTLDRVRVYTKNGWKTLKFEEEE